MMVVLSCSLPAQAGPSCAAAEKNVAGAVARLDAVIARSTQMTIACWVHGPDDAGLTALQREAAATFKVLSAIQDPPAACLKGHLDSAGVGKMLTHAMGERLGLAFGACSTQAQHIIDLPEADRTKKSNEIFDAWAASIFGPKTP